MRKIMFHLALSFGVFLILFVVGYDFMVEPSFDLLFPVLVKALLGAFLFGICLIVIADIIIKGVVSDIATHNLEPLEGGLEQRLHEIKKQKDVNVVKKDVNVVYKEK